MVLLFTLTVVLMALVFLQYMTPLNSCNL